MRTFQKIAKLLRTIIIVRALCFGISMSAECTSVVHQFGEHISTWASNRSIANLHALEALCSKSPSFRIGNKLMTSMADKNSLTKTDTYDWDNYITCLQKEVDNGLQVTFSNISLVPEGYIEMKYPGLQYVSCCVKVNGSLSYELTDLFILKDDKIVKITDYIEKIDEVTGNKKIEIDYLELARAAFGDGDYQKCYDLYKKGGLRKIKSKEKSDWLISDSEIFPYIESCIALNDWEGAVYGFTRIMNRKYWVNGIEWKLNPEDIRDWSYDKDPLMNILLEKTIIYYTSDVDLFRKSPLINHIQNRTGLTTNQYMQFAANYFIQNTRVYADRVKGLKAAAEYGHTDAQRQFGKLYLSGYKLDKEKIDHYEIMLPCDTIKAVYWLDKASENGDIESSKIAAHFQLSGLGIERDYNKAFNNYSNKKVDFDFDIQYGLGLCYYYGLGTCQDLEMALTYLISSEDWHPDIPYLIGNIYYASSNPKAIKYYNKALQRKGIDESVRHEILTILSECNRFGKCGLPINEDEANRLQRESQKYIEKDSNYIKDYFISLTKINFNNEPL